MPEKDKTTMSEEWKKILTPKQFSVLRKKSTEPPFSGKLLHNKKDGVYHCAACGSLLFSSDKKYDSGTGWPSFTAAEGKVDEKEDHSHGMTRIEVLCKKCGGHLGHVFNDGPETVRRADGTSISASGKRYCINSVAMKFEEKD